jgi:hypothetical protein
MEGSNSLGIDNNIDGCESKDEKGIQQQYLLLLVVVVVSLSMKRPLTSLCSRARNITLLHSNPRHKRVRTGSLSMVIRVEEGLTTTSTTTHQQQQREQIISLYRVNHRVCAGLIFEHNHISRKPCRNQWTIIHQLYHQHQLRLLLQQ